MQELLKNKRAVIYTRCSVDSAYTKKESVENQIEVISKYCLDNDFKIIKIYQDDGYSGSNINRPAFQEMINDMKLKKFDTIVVKDLSRFSRNYLEAARYLDEIFPKEKIRFIAINDNYDSATYYDEQSFAIKLWLNNMYIQDIGNKIRFSNEKRAKTTYMSAGCKYGYKKEDGEYKIVEDEAKVIRYIFKLYIEEGLSLEKIANRLEEEQIYSPGYSYYLKNGNVKSNDPNKIINNPYVWASANISRIINDTIYYGTAINRKHIKKNGILKENDNLVEVANAVPAIISKDIYDKAFEIRKSRESFKRKHQNEKLDFVFCKCGGKMGYSCNYYVCHKCSTCIRSHSLYDALYNDIKELLKEILDDKEKLKEIIIKKYNKFDEKKYKELKNEKMKIDKQFAAAFEEMINGKISVDLYSNKVKELNISNDEVESKMNQMSLDLSKKAVLEKELNKFMIKMTNLKLEYSDINLKLFDSLISKVIVEREKRRFKKINIEIFYKFSK